MLIAALMLAQSLRPNYNAATTKAPRLTLAVLPTSIMWHTVRLTGFTRVTRFNG